MLSLTYKALYALDNLRHRANMSYAQVAKLISWNSDQYRIATLKVRDMSGKQSGSLHCVTDMRIRKGISLLIRGFELNYYPLDPSSGRTAHKIAVELNDWFGSCEEDSFAASNDPVGFTEAYIFGTDQSISTDTLISYARPFALQD